MTPFRVLKTVLLIIVLAVPSIGGQHPAENTDWQETLKAARGQTVDWYMWGGSPAVNAYVNGFIAEAVMERYGITLRQVPVKDIAEAVSKLVVEKQAGRNEGGSIDLMWINGENFRTCKSNNLLFGPFAQHLPNQKLVDWSKSSVRNDFGTPVDGLESPWGSAQVVMIYDSARVKSPPKTIPALLDWIQSNPGKFTYPAPPDFTGSVFVRHLFYHAGGQADQWQKEYNRDSLAKASDSTFQLLNDLKPYLWRQGTTYPDSPVRMNNLFADQEIEFSFSYHQAEASRNILDGLFPETVRTYVFEEGTITNTHFVAIPFNAADKAAAMVVADFLLSAEAQLEKAKPDVWGDFPAIDQSRLTPEWQEKFKHMVRGPATLDNSELQAHQLPEPPSEILIHLEKGWQERVLKNR